MIPPKAVAKTSEITVRGRPDWIDDEDDCEQTAPNTADIQARRATFDRYLRDVCIERKVDMTIAAEPVTDAITTEVRRKALTDEFSKGPRR